MDDLLLEQLRRARHERSDAARPDIVTRVHATGRWTARERLDALMDPDSEVRYGVIAALDPGAAADHPAGPFVAETGGLDAVCSIDGQTAVVSSTDYTDRGGGYGAARLGRLFALARAQRWPLVLFVDGGGSRARHPRAGLGHLELSGAIGPYTLFDGMAELSGWVPTISIVSGPSFAGHASVAGFSDIVIATRGSAIGMGGPPMVEAALGKRLTPQELSSAEMQFAGGGIELLVDDEPAAVAAARSSLGYWRDQPGGPPPADATPLATRVPANGPYPMHAVLHGLVDAGSLLELRAPFAPAVIAALARLDGRSIGVLASNPLHDDGRIDEHAAQKIARHVELCDAWGLPLLVLVDAPGTLTRWTARDGTVTREPGTSRGHLRAVLAHQHRQVPLLSVQVRSGGGLAPALLTGYSTGARVPALQLAWPAAAADAVRDHQGNVHDGHATLRERHAFDDIIAPDATRATLVRMLRHLPRDPAPAAKHRAVDSA